MAAIEPATVTIDGRPIPCSSPDWADGAMVSEVVGWFNTGATKAQLANVALAPGAANPSLVLPGPLGFSITGGFRGSQAACEQFGAWLAALSARLVVVSVDASQGPTNRRVLLAPDFQWRGRGFARWAVDCVAPDPRRYGPWRPAPGPSLADTTTAASLTVSNQGTAPSELYVAALRAPSTDRQVVSTSSGQMVFERPRGSGDWVVFDPEAGHHAYLDGSTSLGVRRVGWPTVAGGSSLGVAVSGVSEWRLRVRDAWW